MMRWIGLVCACCMPGPWPTAQTPVRGIEPIATDTTKSETGVQGELRVQGLRADGDWFDFGVYHALLIGIDRYEGHHVDLENAVQDVLDLQQVLQHHYGFAPANVTVLTDADATRERVLAELDRIATEIDTARRAGTSQNLLLYFAGHGVERHWGEFREGFWIPYQPPSTAAAVGAGHHWWNWISIETIKSVTERVPAHHLLIISDSCFAGGLTRERGGGSDDVVASLRAQSVSRWIMSLAEKKSKHVFTSSDREQAADGGRRAGNSVFAKHLLSLLRNNPHRCLPISELANRVTEQVRNDPDSRDQSPLFGRHPRAEQTIGEFVFVRPGLEFDLRPHHVEGYPPGYHAPERVRVERVAGQESWRYLVDEAGIEVEMVLVSGSYIDAGGARIDVAPFLIDRHEVTNERYETWSNATGVAAGRAESDALRRPRQPVSGVTAAEAEAFARYHGSRLPSEQQWELAAGCDADPRRESAPVKGLRLFPWGDVEADGGLPSGDARPPEVGTPSNDVSLFGVHGMAGGVREWCIPGDGDPAEPRRVLRGGSHVLRIGFQVDGPRLRYEIASRRIVDPQARDATAGFRCIKPLVRSGW